MLSEHPDTTVELIEVDNMTWNERSLGVMTSAAAEESKDWREKHITRRYAYRIQDPPVDCERCANVGWICAHADTPADFGSGNCCSPENGGCPSANGCPDCDRARVQR